MNMHSPSAPVVPCRIFEVLQHVGLAQAVEVGRELGLIDALAGFRPSTAEEIAGAVGVDHGVALDWLETMANGGVVRRDAVVGTYWLDTTQAEMLRRVGEQLSSLTRMFTISRFSESASR